MVRLHFPSMAFMGFIVLLGLGHYTASAILFVSWGIMAYFEHKAGKNG